jgi:AraC family transcriptional regulator
MSTGNVHWTKRDDGSAVDLEVLKRKSWPGLTAHFVRIPAPVTYEFKLESSTHYIALHDLYRVDGETIVSGLPPSHSKDLRNKLAFIPAGCACEGWTKIDKSATLIIVTIDQSALSRTSVDLAALPPRIDFDDRMLRWVMLRFQALLDNPSDDIPGYAETLAELLTFDLRRATLASPGADAAPSGLTAKQIQLVTEYMDNHLMEKTTVSELASLLELTRYHFIRSFKQTTGVPPHQFMIRRRVDRAIELLRARTTSIADVADKTGFGSSIQLTRAFRRVVGTTPSAFRRNGR